MDYIELKNLVGELKRSSSTKLFMYVSPSYLRNLFENHPRFRERIIFLWDTLSKKVGEVTYTAEVSDKLKVATDTIYVCPICQVKFTLRPVEGGSEDILCPNRGIRGVV